jgi:hypothetical protein
LPVTPAVEPLFANCIAEVFWIVPFSRWRRVLFGEYLPIAKTVSRVERSLLAGFLSMELSRKRRKTAGILQKASLHLEKGGRGVGIISKLLFYGILPFSG